MVDPECERVRLLTSNKRWEAKEWGPKVECMRTKSALYTDTADLEAWSSTLQACFSREAAAMLFCFSRMFF